jgi:hypothetical protein
MQALQGFWQGVLYSHRKGTGLGDGETDGTDIQKGDPLCDGILF